MKRFVTDPAFIFNLPVVSKSQPAVVSDRSQIVFVLQELLKDSATNHFSSLKKLNHFFRKVQLFILFLVIVNTGIVSAQGWEIVSDQPTMGRAALETSSGNYIATASNCCPGNFPDNFTIMIDPYGNITDSIPVGGFDVTETTDKGFLIPNSEFITRLDSTGNTEWVKAYNPARYQFDILAIKSSHDSAYICIAFSGEPHNGVVVFKINNDGDTLWFRKFGSSKYNFEIPRELLIDTNEMNILCDHDDDSEYHTSVLKLDLNGNLLSHIFIIPSLWATEGFIKTFDNSFAIVGGYELNKVDTLCNLLWSKSFGNLRLRSIKETSDHGFIIAGEQNITFERTNPMMLKTDSAGNLKWMKTYSDPSAEEWVFNYFETIEITDDGGYLACGSKAIFDDSRLFVLKTDSLGEINPTTIESNDITNNISFYPNPFSDFATLRINPNIPDNSLNITIFDIFGRVLSVKPILNEFTIINRNNLPVGVYFLEISNTDSDKLFITKFIIKDK